MPIELESYPTLRNDPSLMHYWRFNGNSVDAKAGNNGVDSNIIYSTGNGRFDQGAGFNGVDSKIQANCPDFGEDGTISLWYKTTLGQYLFDSTTRYLFYLFPWAGNYYIGWWLSYASIFEDSGPGYSVFMTGEWTHLALTWKLVSGLLRTCTIYLNGVQFVQVQVECAVLPSGFLYFGNRFEFDGPLDGCIDDLSIFSRELTATEVLNYYNAGGFQTKNRRTLSPFGTRMGSRQVHAY